MILTRTLLALAAIACATAAQADIVTFSGDTTGGATYNRPLEDLSALSLVGTDVAYSLYEFTVDTAGSYTFLTTSVFDGFSILYSPSFSGAAGLTNAVVANDDLLGLTTSGFATTLTAGTAYVLVTTGFGNSDVGTFTTTIGGPGVITAVPEVGTYAMMALGLAALGLARRRTQG